MQKIGTYILQRPADYLEFYFYVRNIINWGRDVRLPSIKSALDTLLEEGRLAALTESAAPNAFHRRNYKRQKPDYSALRRAIKSDMEKTGMKQDLGIKG
jgi:hypothetical protein